MAYRRFDEGNGKALIGLSLSLCVSEMVREGIKPYQIKKIIAATNAENLLVFIQVIASYRKSYWQEFPWKATWLASKLMVMGKIDQPRTRGERCHSIADGKWVEDESEIKPW